MKRTKKRPPRRSNAPRYQRSRWLTPAICCGLLAITWFVFGRAVGLVFFNYDDSFYVYQNPSISNGLTRAGVVSALTQPLVGNWHPLTSFSLMLDAQFFGLNAGGYHFVNLLLHTATVLLLFFVFRAMTGAVWRSALVAAIFAIHPLRAESVVWVSERKDVLSGVFFMLALGTYYRYARKAAVLGSYLMVVVALTLGLLSKAMLVTFPFLLLVLDYWPLRRFSFSPVTEARGTEERPAPAPVSWLLLEKIPFLGLAVAISIATIVAQKQALSTAENWPLSWRVDNALVAIWIYLRQMVWPADLAVFYPHPKGTLSLWIVGLSLVALLAVTLSVFVARKKYPYLITGWLWYLGMLVPVIGLIQVGAQAHADRYTYLPQIGIYLSVIWAITDLSARWKWRKVILGTASALAISLLMALSWRQVGYWSSSVRLWRHTLAVTTNNDVAERGLGTELLRLGQVDEAIAHDRAALRIHPRDANGLTNLANALLQKKEYPEAIRLYREVIGVRPNDSEMRRNLGKALYQSGAIDQAVAEFREALRIRPHDSDAAYSLGNIFLEKGDAEAAIPYFRKATEANRNNVAARYNLAIALQRNGDLEQAIAQFRQTLQLDPRNVGAHNNLAITFLKAGQAKDAIAEWEAALRLQPNNAEMHNNLAVALLEEGRVAAAVREWQETLRLQPDRVGTQITLSWILATAPESTVRDGARALALAQRAFQVTAPRNPLVFRVLAAAYAENAQFPAAIETAEEGARRADAEGQPAIAQLLQGDLGLYQQGIPLRDPTHGRGATNAR
jgi:tetratricopeptide (TPR) repeat protein